MTLADESIQAVWEKASPVVVANARIWRKDECGAWIGRRFYCDRMSQYGWEIAHIKPVSAGGTDEVSNLRALQWQNNTGTQAGRLTCVVTAAGGNNRPK